LGGSPSRLPVSNKHSHIFDVHGHDGYDGDRDDGIICDYIDSDDNLQYVCRQCAHLL